MKSYFLQYRCIVVHSKELVKVYSSPLQFTFNKNKTKSLKMKMKLVYLQMATCTLTKINVWVTVKAKTLSSLIFETRRT